jgi:2-methylcitrate dehydratase PrpD
VVAELTERRYAVAFLDWLACAARGADERAARAARAAGDDVVALATAGHVLDFDDTYLPGIAHLSAPTAPVALVLGAQLGATLADVLSAYAAGFEAMGALARASHPALYERGWHPTAVCGTVGAAVAAVELLDAPRDTAVALAALRAAGSRAGFGSDGKALGVGLAAAAGVAAARLAAGGASVPRRAVEGFERVTGGTWAEPDGAPAVDENWIKPWPCCLMAHSAIECALSAGSCDGPLVVRVHPRARQAAPHDDVADGLQAKFSIPYLVAFTLVHGGPEVASFAGVDAAARARARELRVVEDDGLGESAARLERPDGEPLAHVEYALGSPQRPLGEERLAAKVASLTGGRFDALPDGSTPAQEVLARATAGAGPASEGRWSPCCT